VQDNGVNLFVLHLPITVGGTRPKCLAVGFYPDEAQSATYFMLDPRQKADWEAGRLVILKTLELEGTQQLGDGFGSVSMYMGPLHDGMIAEIKRNNRNSRRDLKRQSSELYLKQEIANALEAQEEKKIQESGFLDAYTEAYMDSEHHVRGNPRVSQYTGK
jgi:hypothetical protein